MADPRFTAAQTMLPITVQVTDRPSVRFGFGRRTFIASMVLSGSAPIGCIVLNLLRDGPKELTRRGGGYPYRWRFQAVRFYRLGTVFERFPRHL